MVSIKIREDEPFEKALRRFKKKWEKAGILRDVRARAYYIKPSEAVSYTHLTLPTICSV